MDRPEPSLDRVDSRLVVELAGQLGFGLVGIAPAQASDHVQAVRNWIAADKHGQMHYLKDNLEVRLDPKQLLEGARSIICLADFYPQAAGDVPEPKQLDVARGRVARYAWGDDYHKTIKKRLFALADRLCEEGAHIAPAGRPGLTPTFRCVVDTAPLLEREHASRAGLGWVGKNTMLIHPVYGSWMLLGFILTTLPLETSQKAGYPDATVAPADHCGTCTRCIDACPTKCIAPAGYALDANRCISYLSLEHRTAIEPSLHPLMGNWIAGCDICQEVCPHNRGQRAEGPRGQVKSAEVRQSLVVGLSLLEILDWTVEDRQAAFRGSALKRIKLDMLKRNALIAAGNHLVEHQDAALAQRIKQMAHDSNEPDMVRLTARQVLDRLGRETG
jgi:epoxyqueuosine reductase